MGGNSKNESVRVTFLFRTNCLNMLLPVKFQYMYMIQNGNVHKILSGHRLGIDFKT